MKIKSDFVTNSSSASFIIEKKNLTERQIYEIKNHMDVVRRMAKKNGWHKGIHYYEQMDTCIGNDSDKWNIVENEEFIAGDTIMTNFNMENFLSEIGIKNEYIVYIGD